MHGSNRLGGNSLSDLLVFGRRAGLGAVEYVDSLGDDRPSVPEAEVEAAAVAEALAPYEREGGENPYAVHQELQQTMNDLVGIIRREEELKQAIEALGKLRERVDAVAVEGGRGYHPGWHLALDLRNMVLVSECVAKAALERQESRGGHTRDDYPADVGRVAQGQPVCRSPGTARAVSSSSGRQDMDPMREDLIGLFELDELKKYLTEGELPSEEK